MVQPNPQARRRFVDETIRVVGVLEAALSGREWLVGGKCTAADLVFVPFMQSLKVFGPHLRSLDTIFAKRRILTQSFPKLQVNLNEDAPDLANSFPGVHGWMQRMGTRASVKKVTGERASVLEAARRAQGQ